ncbi:hypothetical protein [Alkalicoccobacillus porphyridii]|uniref:Uncharacterized protein n=1 Tax=Alkalicoccobacillus porphyridii TaxID=2597270 RepID=A0A553ZT51_9BACI|nr:hypothetical protein [Alkalicoccobacillus porphyridii]TSB44642.1 hypothetical protein FN960_20480 [Alkalicoccobacillus porphyridii]
MVLSLLFLALGKIGFPLGDGGIVFGMASWLLVMGGLLLVLIASFLVWWFCSWYGGFALGMVLIVLCDGGSLLDDGLFLLGKEGSAFELGHELLFVVRPSASSW